LGINISLVALLAVVHPLPSISLYGMSMSPTRAIRLMKKYMPSIHAGEAWAAGAVNRLAAALTWDYTGLVPMFNQPCCLQFVIQNLIIDHDKIWPSWPGETADQGRRQNPNGPERLEQMQKPRRSAGRRE